jgi:50S ribosomal subunit-associated GTPase HflX
MAALGERALVAWNKADVAPGPLGGPGTLAISALTGQGVEELGRRILDKLDYRPAEPGAAVPLAASQAEALEAARRALASGDAAEARPCLQALLPTKPA